MCELNYKDLSSSLNTYHHYFCINTIQKYQIENYRKKWHEFKKISDG